MEEMRRRMGGRDDFKKKRRKDTQKKGNRLNESRREEGEAVREWRQKIYGRKVCEGREKYAELGHARCEREREREREREKDRDKKNVV